MPIYAKGLAILNINSSGGTLSIRASAEHANSIKISIGRSSLAISKYEQQHNELYEKDDVIQNAYSHTFNQFSGVFS